MTSIIRVAALLGIAGMLAACEHSQNAYNGPGDLVDTDVFVANVMREQGLIASGSAPQ